MAATLTRGALRRARLGGRHAYRAAARHRAALAVTAAFAAVTMGGAVAATHDVPTRFEGPPPAHAQLHGPMADHMHLDPWGPGRN